MDSISSRSPTNSSLNNSGSFGRPSKRRALKSDALKQQEKSIREQESDTTSDFIDYLELLVDYFKQLDLLDSAGRKLLSVF